MELGRSVGAGHPPFIISTRCTSSLANLEQALAAIDEAADAHCDAIKLGTGTEPRLPHVWCSRLFQRAEQRGIALLARPENEIEVTRFDWIGARAYDLSFEVSDLELIATALRTQKPVFLSVGQATHEQLVEIAGMSRHGYGGIAMIVPLHDARDLERLEAVRTLGVPVGISDAQPHPDLALEGITRGASIVEKRRVDHSALVHTIRHCELAWSSLGYAPVWATN